MMLHLFVTYVTAMKPSPVFSILALSLSFTLHVTRPPLILCLLNHKPLDTNQQKLLGVSILQ